MESLGPGLSGLAVLSGKIHENPPSNRFFLQFGFSDHGYTTANPRNRLLYKLETDDEALDVRRSSFSDPFNASHDSGFMMDPSLFAIPAVDDRRLRSR